MKIESARGVSQSSAAGSARRAASASGFAPVVDAEPATRTAPTSSASAIASVDAILALQAEGLETERRSRQARRGKAALDALASLQKGLALGVVPAGLRSELERLGRNAEATGEAGLDGVLLEIDTRVAVELAKLEREAL